MKASQCSLQLKLSAGFPSSARVPAQLTSHRHDMAMINRSFVKIYLVAYNLAQAFGWCFFFFPSLSVIVFSNSSSFLHELYISIPVVIILLPILIFSYNLLHKFSAMTVMLKLGPWRWGLSSNRLFSHIRQTDLSVLLEVSSVSFGNHFYSVDLTSIICEKARLIYHLFFIFNTGILQLAAFMEIVHAALGTAKRPTYLHFLHAHEISTDRHSLFCFTYIVDFSDAFFLSQVSSLLQCSPPSYSGVDGTIGSLQSFVTSNRFAIFFCS